MRLPLRFLLLESVKYTKKGGSVIPGLGEAKEKYRLWYHIWDQCDRPRNGPLFQIVKSTKKKYIKLVATWKKQQVKDISTKIRNNPKLLYNEVNRLTQSSADLSDQIPLEQWYGHFTSVFSSNPPSTELSYRELLYKHFSQLNPYKDLVRFSPYSVLIQISSLKCGKALGPDGLLSEHLLYGTTKLLEHLTLLYQVIVIQHYVPSLMGEGRAVCIRKKGKDPSYCPSSRPITLCSVINKLFENILLPYLSTKCDVGDHQLGFRSGVGVQNAHAIFLEILEHHHNFKKQLFVCGVDISKAFDSMLHNHQFIGENFFGRATFRPNFFSSWSKTRVSS